MKEGWQSKDHMIHENAVSYDVTTPPLLVLYKQSNYGQEAEGGGSANVVQCTIVPSDTSKCCNGSSAPSSRDPIFHVRASLKVARVAGDVGKIGKLKAVVDLQPIKKMSNKNNIQQKKPEIIWQNLMVKMALGYILSTIMKH